MFTSRKTFIALSLFAVVSMASPARAGLDDTVDAIWTYVQQARNRATEARDKAIDAGKRAIEARDLASDLKDVMDAASENLSPAVREMIAEAVVDIGNIIEQELEGREAFLNSSAPEDFRADLVTLLQEVELIINTQAQLYANASLQVSFDDEVAIIQKLPAHALWPAYRITSEMDFLNGALISRLKETGAALAYIVPLLNADGEDAPASDSLIDKQLNGLATKTILEDTSRAEKAAALIRGTSIALKLVGKGLQSLGQKGVSEYPAQVWGWVGVQVKASPSVSWGLKIEGVSDALGKVATSFSEKIDRAMLIGSLAELRGIQNAILANQQAILAGHAEPVAAADSDEDDDHGGNGRGRGRRK